jgi:hypothetical protein
MAEKCPFCEVIAIVVGLLIFLALTNWNKGS